MSIRILPRLILPDYPNLQIPGYKEIRSDHRLDIKQGSV